MKLPLVMIGVLLTASGVAPGIERAQDETSLARVKRVYVENLGGGAGAAQMRDMIIAAIQNSRVVLITEDPDRADAVLRGSSDDTVFNEDHNSSESLGLHANSGIGSSSSNSTSGGTASHANGGVGLTDSESSHIQERRHEASASVRMVNGDGDVIWSTTQESSGGKFRGAMADIADKITRQLTEDVRKARGVAEKNNTAEKNDTKKPVP